MAAEATQADPVLDHSSGVDHISRSAASFWWQLACAVGINGLLLWFFHNHFWYPPDEGNYAHVAQRILAGEVLNLNVEDIHPGYINFVNAFALRVFGANLLSLRYPLITIAFVQAILLFLLFYRTGRRELAIPAAVGINALGLIQFLNPTSNWYSLFLVILIIVSLEWLPTQSRSRLLVVGFLIGTLVLFRQLSGVIVCISVVAYLLIETRSFAGERRTGNTILARLVVAIMAIGLGGYLLRATDAIGLALFGSCPMLILLWLFAKTTTGNRQVLRILGSLAIGGMLACLPLLLYHLLHGSTQAWLNDTIVRAVGLTKLSFMDQQLYGKLIYLGFRQVFRISSVGALLNGLYWIMLPLLGLGNGILVLRSLVRVTEPGRTTASAMTSALPVLATFYAVVSIHFQIPIYLYYSAGLSLAGIMWLMPQKSRLKYVALSISLLLSGVAVFYHAAQPLSGRFDDFFGGRRNVMSLNRAVSSLPRATLKIGTEDDKRYSDILKVIESETGPDDTIFALPTNAELYFLANRRNPFRFYNSALGIRTESDFQQVRETIITRPPKLVLYSADDKYNTDYSREVMRVVQERYDFLGETSGFAVYRSRQNPAG